MKASRQRRIAGLIRQTQISSQNQLVNLLIRAGYPVTQATISRDLDELGAVKVRREGKVAYVLPAESGFLPPGDALKRLLSDSVSSLESTGNLVVVKTPPGHAGMVGGALDRIGLDGVAGTVAGDDTVLVVCKTGVLPRRVERRIRSMVESLPPAERVKSNGNSSKGL
ncbi:MAG TPA: arginine repressor [Actinomycetota bacterium]|jgi:transcriptional regulator of arginine metabolism|nr:arginine repressor [Actinomycetota bacterium]